ncbi:MAG: cobalamin B12-binding domain-containing protein [Chloroflexi bacterium]|nr:cobalamin B12-binding domain-containing protein [Chloroflexota bacterium]
MTQDRPIRVLIAKPGLDGHSRGAWVVTMGLRDHGMEVIYTGLRQTAEAIVQAAVQEDVDVVGLSCMSATYDYYFPKVVQLLRETGVDDVLVIGGGVIPPEDAAVLKEKGVDAVFGPGTLVKDIAAYIQANLKRPGKAVA